MVVHAGDEGEIRLQERTDNGSRTEGVLEIFHAGAWGTFCNLALRVNPFQNIFPEVRVRVAHVIRSDSRKAAPRASGVQPFDCLGTVSAIGETAMCRPTIHYMDHTCPQQTQEQQERNGSV